MKETYLIKIRLGRTKRRIKETIVAIAHMFQVRYYIEKHPHVILYGPFELNEGISR